MKQLKQYDFLLEKPEPTFGILKTFSPLTIELPQRAHDSFRPATSEIGLPLDPDIKEGVLPRGLLIEYPFVNFCKLVQNVVK